MAANNKVKLDVTLPLTDVGGASETVQRFAQEAEALGFHHSVQLFWHMER